MGVVLGWSDQLPGRPRRILVAGPSGSGKSTLAAELGRLLGVPYTELDSLRHGPGWAQRPAFGADVAALIASPAWITEWQHAASREAMLRRAELVVFLDLPLRVVAARLVRRTLLRRVRRTVLWNGNREPPLYTVLTDPEHVLRTAAAGHRKARLGMAQVLGRPDAPPSVRLRSPREVRTWLSGLPPPRELRIL